MDAKAEVPIFGHLMRRTDAFKLRTLESPLDFKDIKPVNPKGNQSGIFTGRMDAKAEALVFGHLM